MAEVNTPTNKKKDFESDQAVRWCPGRGDYAILAQAQKTMPTFGRKKEEFVFQDKVYGIILPRIGGIIRKS